MTALLADMKSVPTDVSIDVIAPEIETSGEESEDNEVRLVFFLYLVGSLMFRYLK